MCVTRGRMHDEPCGFVDDDQPTVLVGDAKRDVFGDELRHDDGRRRPDDDLVRAKLARRRTTDCIRDRDGALTYLADELRPRRRGGVRREHDVESPARLVGGDDEADGRRCVRGDEHLWRVFVAVPVVGLGYQIRDLTCPLDFSITSTSARS